MISVITLYISHVIGSFYFQSDNIVNRKDNAYKSLILQSILYITPYIYLFYFIPLSVTLYTLFLLFILYIFIEKITLILKKQYAQYSLIIFIMNQLSYLIILWAFAHFISMDIIINKTFLVTLLSIFILFKPVGIIISLIMKTIFKNENESDKVKVGRYIGYLERSIVFLLCMFNSVSTIGFIIAAKTLVRYKDIHEDINHFQEKYLIGTLLSTIGALLCYGVILLL